jgi:hypothetical protein
VSARAGQEQILCAHFSVMVSNIVSGMISGSIAPRAEFYICHLSSPQAMTNDNRKINKQASTHPDKGQCLPRSSLSPGKNTIRVATPPSEHYMIRILSPLDLTHLNPSPVPWGF